MTKTQILRIFITLGLCAAVHAYRIQEIPSPHPTPGSDYGWASATDGQTLVIGAKDENDAGVVYVYEHNGSNWDYITRLEPNSIGSTDEAFGYAVSVDGETIVIGAPVYNNFQGAAYVFVKDSSNGWNVDPMRLVTGNGSFGRSVAIDNDTLVVGCPDENYEQGAVYVYERLLNRWFFKQRLEDSDGKGSDDQQLVSIDGDRLGYSVDIDGDIIVAGAYYDVVEKNRRQGSVCVFRRSGGDWAQASEEKLTASDGQELDLFGYDVEICGDLMAVGSPHRDNGSLMPRGSVYFFQWTGSHWDPQAEPLVSPDDYDGHISVFGQRLSLDGHRVVVGDYYFDAFTGRAFLFEWDGRSWSSGTSLINGHEGDRIGSSVAISGDTIFIGAYGASVGDVTDAGTVYRVTLPVKRFHEFQVNTWVKDDQRYPAIASDPNGNFIIVWDSDEQDGAYSDIYAQRFDAYGRRIGSEFPVNTSTDGSQYNAAVAMNAAGEFIIAWNGWGPNTDSEEIFLRRYASDGTPLSDELQINTYTVSRQAYPAIALNDDGSFIVIWDSFHGNNDWRVAGRVYDASGNPATDEFDINQTGTIGEISLAVEDNKDFTVTWIRGLPGYQIYARQYFADGTAKGDEFIIFTPDYDDAALGPTLATNGTGSYVLAWHYTSEWPAYEHRDIYTQLFDPNLSPVSAPIMVNTTTDGAQQNPSVSMNHNGDFVIAWRSNTDGDMDGIYARQYNRNGLAMSNQYQVNTYTLDNQRSPVASMQESGRFVIAWHSEGQDSSEKGVFAAIGPAAWGADFDHNGQVDPNDLVLMADRWLENEPVFDIAPADGIVNLADFSILTEQWMLGL